MDDDVPGAWFYAADKARNAMLREDPNDQIGALMAAIAAVAPLIRAAEMEACALIADKHCAPDRPTPKWASDEQRQSIYDEALGEKIASERIAAAIRARGADDGGS